MLSMEELKSQGAMALAEKDVVVAELTQGLSAIRKALAAKTSEASELDHALCTTAGALKVDFESMGERIASLHAEIDAKAQVRVLPACRISTLSGAVAKDEMVVWHCTDSGDVYTSDSRVASELSPPPVVICDGCGQWLVLTNRFGGCRWLTSAPRPSPSFAASWRRQSLSLHARRYRVLATAISARYRKDSRSRTASGQLVYVVTLVSARTLHGTPWMRACLESNRLRQQADGRKRRFLNPAGPDQEWTSCS